ncbi:MAG: helix-turn-helix domain-containing protein [Bacteroidetes bacterium]|nr:helix-turn-helix domain-containing protein [Bacteroidota bacterium]
MNSEKISYPKTACACAVSLDLLGDKWSLLIIRDLFRGKSTYSEFLKQSQEGIATNILVDRLKKLLAMGIIDFKRESHDKKIKKYFLTDRGIDLYPVIYEFQRWTLKHVDFDYTDNTKNWNDLIQNTPQEEVINQYQNGYRALRLSEFGF